MSIVPPSIYKPLPDDIYQLRETHFENWERFFFQPFSNDHLLENLTGVRDIVLQSWKRSKEFKELSPLSRGSNKNVPDEQLKEIRKNSVFFHLAKPIVKHFEKELTHTNHVLLLCNNEGVIMEGYGEPSTLSHLADSANATEGAVWSERWAGTNAIGTSIYLKQPVQIFSTEHFAHGCHEWVCSAAPIMNPITNELLGVVNLSTTATRFQPTSMIKAIEIVNKMNGCCSIIFTKPGNVTKHLYWNINKI